MEIKRMNDRACDNFLNNQRAMQTASANMQQQQAKERKDREQNHKNCENERDRTDLAYAHSTKLQPSENRLAQTQKC